MVIPMVGLVILVVFISNSASNVTTEDRYRMYKSRRRRSVKFSVFHIPYAGFMNQSHIYTRV